MFVLLSFVKIFHWLVADRVDFIETTPNVTRLQHARIVAFTLVLLVSGRAAAGGAVCVFVWALGLGLVGAGGVFVWGLRLGLVLGWVGGWVDRGVRICSSPHPAP